jgi:pantetheine-phosphate adenylyltransferase
VARALYAGSFDPVHLGHLGVIEIAARAFDDVVVAVLANPHKTDGMFSADQRVALLIEAVACIDNVTVRRFDGLTVDLARATGATVLVRSFHKELGDEITMAALNGAMAGLPTVFTPADPGRRSISSSLVRELVDRGRLDEAIQLVPDCVADALTRRA